MAKVKWQDKYKKIEQMVSEGNEVDLVGQICAILYGKDHYRTDDMILTGGEIKDYVRGKYSLELDREHKERQIEENNKNYKKQLEKELAEETDEEDAKRLKKELDRLHRKEEMAPKRRLEKGKMSPLFTNLLEEGEGFSQEEYNRNKRFDIYYRCIHQDFASFYKDISDKIIEMPQLLKDDLNYIILQELASMTTEVYEVGNEKFLKWEEEYENGQIVLRIPEIKTGDGDKYVKKLLKEIEKMSKEKTAFPIRFESYINMEKECLCIQRNNIKIQLALLFYGDFRRRFTISKKMPKNDFSKLSSIIENINKISLEKNDIEKIDTILFPYVIERVTGINLCIGYAEYYAAFKNHNEWDKKVEKQLKNIFGYFSAMPNVFSRVQIMMNLMDLVLLFDKELKRQLTILENIVRDLCHFYQDICNGITEIIKDKLKNENLRVQYLCEIEKRCFEIDELRKSYRAENEENYLFVKKYEECEQDSVIYKELQREYVKNINL